MFRDLAPQPAAPTTLTAPLLENAESQLVRTANVAVPDVVTTKISANLKVSTGSVENSCE